MDGDLDSGLHFTFGGLIGVGFELVWLQHIHNAWMVDLDTDSDIIRLLSSPT